MNPGPSLVHLPAAADPRPPRVRAAEEARVGELRAELLAAWPDPVALHLEIGCGHGHFLAAYAAAHPETACLGIDLLSDRLARAARKLERAGLRHARVLKAEAHQCLAALPPHVTLARVLLLYPDPWPKKRHHKHRLLREPFLARLAAHALPGAELWFRTDHAEYFASALEALAASADWEPGGPGEAWPFEAETVFGRRTGAAHSLRARRR